ncbi:RNA polymerase II transcription mediator complex subunit 9-domain-containing protein [Xylariomycetidae sp. FL2044]|nr:RNA polymerase II transcription mediator complex subunit 9-domain-containing protein [Xylariomycetidae sp. FL2044]
MATSQSPTSFTLPEGLNPDTLDTLTELANLLTRLRAPAPPASSSTAPPTATTTAGPTPAAAATSSQHHQLAPPPSTSHTQSHTHQHQQQQRGATPAAPTPSQALSHTQSSLSLSLSSSSPHAEQLLSLSLKEIPNATDALKHRFQRARAQIRRLPDLGRDVGEQEREIRELEARLARQRDVLMRLREVGARFGAGAEEEGVVRMEE